jgi:hypothetical protein
MRFFIATTAVPRLPAVPPEYLKSTTLVAAFMVVVLTAVRTVRPDVLFAKSTQLISDAALKVPEIPVSPDVKNEQATPE